MSSETGSDACNGNVIGGIRTTIENHTGYEGGPARIGPHSSGLNGSYFGSRSEIIDFVARFEVLNPEI